MTKLKYKQGEKDRVSSSIRLFNRQPWAIKVEETKRNAPDPRKPGRESIACRCTRHSKSKVRYNVIDLIDKMRKEDLQPVSQCKLDRGIK